MKQIAAAVDNQAEWFATNMKKVVTKMQSDVLAMLKAFEQSGGNMLNTPANIQLASGIYTNLIKAINEAGYSDLVQQLQNQEGDLLKAIRASQPSGSIPLAFTESGKQQLIAANANYALNFDAVSTDSMKNIKTLMLDSVMRGGSQELLIENIRSILETRLMRYANTYAITSRQKFIQAVQDAAASDFGEEVFWQYVGPEDQLTRPACLEGLAIEYFTAEERDQFEAETASERFYNCRHYFVPITKEFYQENAGTKEDKKTETPAQGEYEQLTTKINASKTDSDITNILNDLGVKNVSISNNNELYLDNAKQVSLGIADMKTKYGKDFIEIVDNIKINSISKGRANGKYYYGENRINTRGITKDSLARQMIYRADRIANNRVMWTVSSNSILHDTIIHEYGHALHQKLQLRFDGYRYNKIVNESYRQMRTKKRNLFNKMKNSQEYINADVNSQIKMLQTYDRNILTEYGLSSSAEYFAESFVAYHSKRFDIMDNNMIKLFDEVLKDRK